MVEPDQQQFNKHFSDLASGKVIGDNDLQMLSRRGLGGHHHKSVNYKMAYDPNPKDPRPIQNVTSDIASSINQAKSRLGKAIKLGEEVTGVSSSSDSPRHHTKSSSKKRKHSSSKHKSSKKNKKKKSKEDKKKKK